MPLTPYCAAVLARELAGTDYNGLTADQGWAWLMLSTAQSPLTRPTGLKLTPVVLAGLVGAAKAEACAAALKAAYPVTGDHLMTEGIDPTKAESQTFIAGLVTANILTPADANTIAAACVQAIAQPDLPRRFDTHFEPSRWPHVAVDGSAGTNSDPAIHGFPNDLARADFDSAWAQAGRS